MAGPFALYADESGLPHTTRRNIPYEIESVPSLRQQWRRGANRTTIVCRVKDATALTWVEDMVGQTYTVGSSPSRTLRRYLPQANPLLSDPDKGGQWCVDVDEIDAGQDPDDPKKGPGRNPTTGWPEYRWSRWRVTFEGMPHRMRTDDEVDEDSATYANEAPELFRYCIRSRKTFVKEQQVPGGAFKIIGSGTPGNRQPLQQTGFKVVLMADVSYTLGRWPVDAIPLTAFGATAGKYNLSQWDIGPGGYKWDAGTLLFTGWDDDNKYFDADGDWVCDLVIRFRWRQIGYNFFVDNEWQPKEVSLDGETTGQRPYAATDSLNFNPLFQAEP